MKSVLIVDDEAICRLLFTRVLQQADYSVDAVECGADALEAIEGRMYDAILMDMQMPGIDGCTLAQRIRGRFDAASGNAPRLVLLSATHADARPQAHAPWPFDAQITKDAAVDGLCAFMTRLFEKDGATPAAMPANPSRIDLGTATG